MSQDHLQTAAIMVRQHERRAGFVALVQAARAWSSGDAALRAYWRGVVAAIVDLRVPTKGQTSGETRH